MLSGKKKFSLVSGNRMDETFLSLTRRHIRMCIRTYIKLKRKISKKPQQNNNTKKQKKLKKKDSICGKTNLMRWYHLRICKWYHRITLILRNHSIYYTTKTYELHAFKNKNKIKSLLRDIFVYHFPGYICSFEAANLWW